MYACHPVLINRIISFKKQHSNSCILKLIGGGVIPPYDLNTDRIVAMRRQVLAGRFTMALHRTDLHHANIKSYIFPHLSAHSLTSFLYFKGALIYPKIFHKGSHCASMCMINGHETLFRPTVALTRPLENDHQNASFKSERVLSRALTILSVYLNHKSWASSFNFLFSLPNESYDVFYNCNNFFHFSESGWEFQEGNPRNCSCVRRSQSCFIVVSVTSFVTQYGL